MPFSLARRSLFLFVLAAVPFATSCQSTYYATMEKFGVHKRDILVDRVQDGREDQQQAKEQIQKTLDVYKELTGFDGGELEEMYQRMKVEYERSENRAEDVRDRIDSIESVASALFEEWQGEISEMESANLRKRSQEMLDDTKTRYSALIGKMQAAEEKMGPVLKTFSDHVIFLKHSLNAQAIDSLRDTALEIEDDVSALIADMQSSIDEADAFIAAMDG